MYDNLINGDGVITNGMLRHMYRGIKKVYFQNDIVQKR